MRIPRLVAVEFVRALRWPGALGALLLAGSGAYALAVLLPAREEAADLQSRAERAERRDAAVRSGAEAAPLTPAQRREQFYRALPAQSEITQHIQRIYAAAAEEKLSLLRGEYQGAEVPKTDLVRLRIVLPTKGSYGQVRRFVAAATQAVPGLVLDDLALQRQNVADGQVDARVHLSLFLAKR